MKIIGITGKSGSGKSTLALLLANKLKCESVNIDKIGHKATNDKKITKKLCDIFGNQILDEKGIIDRKKLGNIVFSSKEKMNILTQITWGYMQKILDELLSKEPEFIILEWALLPTESKYWEKCDTKILIKSDDIERKNKVIQRDKISEEYFQKRDAKSVDYTPYYFNYIFENDYKLETMEKNTCKIIENMLKY